MAKGFSDWNNTIVVSKSEEILITFFTMIWGDEEASLTVQMDSHCLSVIGIRILNVSGMNVSVLTKVVISFVVCLVV